MTRVWFAALAVTTACGGHSDTHQPDAIAINDGPAVDAPPGYSTLISRMWTLPANSQGYMCTRLQVAQDMWFTGFRPLSPSGTHEETLTMSSTLTGPLGDYSCTPTTNDPEVTYAAGIGTDDVDLPAGVAVHLTAGVYINLNLHVSNTTAGTLSGESGVLAMPVDSADVVNDADMAFAGTTTINIPADGQPHTAQGSCATHPAWNVLTLWPHMHETATHQTLVVTHAAVSTTMLDVAFDYTDQKNYPMGDMLVQQNDLIQVTCTYINNTMVNPIVYGVSDSEETCFTGLYKYPTGNDLDTCID